MPQDVMAKGCSACRDSFITLVEEYDSGRDCAGKAAWLSSKLGMQLPPSADRYSPLHCPHTCTPQAMPDGFPMLLSCMFLDGPERR